MKSSLIFTLAALLVVLMSNVYVGRAEEEPFGKITKLWEVQNMQEVTGHIEVDTSHQQFVNKRTATQLDIRNLSDGSVKKVLNMPNGIDGLEFIDDNKLLVIYTGYFWDSPRYEFYNTETWELSETKFIADKEKYGYMTRDRSMIITGKLVDDMYPVLIFYDYQTLELIDTLYCEMGQPYGYPPKIPEFKLSPDNKRIITEQYYAKWQILPNATVYNVYDLNTKKRLIRKAITSPTEFNISNDWKNMYVCDFESEYGHGLLLTKISLETNEEIENHFFKGISNTTGFISENNKYLILNGYQKFIVIDLSSFGIVDNNGLPEWQQTGGIDYLDNNYMFFLKKYSIKCYSTHDSFLTDVNNTDGDQISTLYPNPTNNSVILQVSEPISKLFLMTDLTGRDIPIMERLRIFDTSVEIDMNGLKTGTYFLQVTDNKTSLTYKIIKN